MSEQSKQIEDNVAFTEAAISALSNVDARKVKNKDLKVMVASVKADQKSILKTLKSDLREQNRADKAKV